MVLDKVGSIVSEDNDIAEVKLAREFNLMFEQRFAADGDHRLWQISKALA
jgi:hypothetical protein